jgi:hypothetical protein
LLSLIEIIGCAPLCWVPCDGCIQLKICKFAIGINKLLDLTDSIIGAVKDRPDVTGSPYCKAAESIDLDELVGETLSSSENTLEES